MILRGLKSGSKLTTKTRQELRTEATSAEKIFWSKVGRRQFYDLKFRRQHGIGNYIVDFYCPEKKLVVEIDGDTHAGSDAIKRDNIRTKFIESLGYTVIRYTNSDVINNIEGVFEDLSKKLNLF